MSKIQIPIDYNYWYILANAGIDPVLQKDRYDYNEVTEELTVDVPQTELENAFNQYDHESWLIELEKNKNSKTETELLQQKVAQLEQIIDTMLTGGTI